MPDEELYELACAFIPFKEKDRAKRTKDTMDAIFKLQDYRDKIELTLAKLQSDNVLSEKDADVVVNFNVPEVSSLIRPHAVERHWKRRWRKAQKALEDAKHRKDLADLRGQPYVETLRAKRARAFLTVFTIVEKSKWIWESDQPKPSQAWHDYFKSVYHSTVTEEE